MTPGEIPPEPKGPHHDRHRPTQLVARPDRGHRRGARPVSRRRIVAAVLTAWTLFHAGYYNGWTNAERFHRRTRGRRLK